jgi:hypothetical protein
MEKEILLHEEDLLVEDCIKGSMWGSVLGDVIGAYL